MATTVPKTLIFRGYQEGDEPKIQKMFKTIFGRRYPLVEWHWKFQDNPYAPPQAYMAFQPDEELVAHYTMMPVQFNVMGKPVLAAQSIDTMVSPKQRGKKLFEKTAAACYDRFERAGGALVFGFPNENSYPGFMRKLEWKRITHLKEYTLRLGVHQLSKTVLKNRWAANLTDKLYRKQGEWTNTLQRALFRERLPGQMHFHTSDTVPDATDDLWHSIRSYSVFSVWKDKEYMKWRYDANPRHRFQYAYLTQNGKILALAVLTQEAGETMYIADLLVRNHDLMTARYLMSEIAALSRKQGYDKLTFIGADGGFFDSVFADWQSQLSPGLILCARGFGLDNVQDMLVQPHNWTISIGDTDIL